MLRRVLRFAAASSFGRGWLQKSPTWFGIGAALWLFRILDTRLAKKPRTKRSGA
ncbi:MAG: hypothetical protein WAN30_04085 [Acidimicrobiales bacterium]